MFSIRSRWELGILGLLALIAISPVGQIIAVIGMISVLRLPIAVLVISIPSFFLVVVAGHLTWSVWRNVRVGHRLRALAFALSLLAMADGFVFRALARECVARPSRRLAARAGRGPCRRGRSSGDAGRLADGPGLFRQRYALR